MGKLDWEGLDELSLTLADIADIPNKVIGDMLNAQADVVSREQKRNAKTLLGKAGKGEGITAESIKKTDVKYGLEPNIKIEFKGKRSGRKPYETSNAYIAYINEFGNSKTAATQFIKLANEKSNNESLREAERIYDNFLKSKGV